MSVKKVERSALEKFKPGWKKDRRTGAWFTWQVDYYDERGVRKRKRGFHSEAEAKEFLHDNIRHNELKRLGLVSTKEDFPLLRDVLERRLKDIPQKRQRTQAKRVFSTFLGMFPGEISVDVLRTKHYKDFAELRLGQKVMAETVNRESAFIMSALKSAHLNFPVLEDWNPPKGYYCETNSRRKKERIISEDEESRILGWLDRARQPKELLGEYEARVRTALIFRFALLTGLRHGEIVGIKKSDVGPDELTVWRNKTRTVTTFPMTDEMNEVIERADKLFKGDYVFSRSGVVQGRTWTQLKKACEAVGVPYGRAGGVVLHTSRHTFITRLMRAGVDIATIQSFSSHSDREMVMKYSHATEGSRLRALAALGGKREKRLREIYEKVKSGKMDIETFIKQVSKN